MELEDDFVCGHLLSVVNESEFREGDFLHGKAIQEITVVPVEVGVVGDFTA